MPTNYANYSANELVPVYHDEARTMSVRLGANLTLAAGTVIAQNSTDNKWYAYVDAGANGTGTARLILQYDCKTDAQGRVAFGTESKGEWGQTSNMGAPAYFRGTFRKGDLTGLDANAVTDMGARYLTGGTTPNDDLLRIP